MMSVKDKMKFGEEKVREYLENKGYIVEKAIKDDTLKRGIGYDFIVKKDDKKFKVEVKATENQRGRIPDMYHTEFYESENGLSLVADFLFVVRISEDKSFKIERIPKKQIDYFADKHNRIEHVRLGIGTKLRDKEIGLSDDADELDFI